MILSAVFSLYNQSCGPQHVPTCNADTLEAMWADLSDVLRQPSLQSEFRARQGITVWLFVKIDT